MFLSFFKLLYVLEKEGITVLLALFAGSEHLQYDKKRNPSSNFSYQKDFLL